MHHAAPKRTQIAIARGDSRIQAVIQMFITWKTCRTIVKLVNQFKVITIPFSWGVNNCNMKTAKEIANVIYNKVYSEGKRTENYYSNDFEKRCIELSKNRASKLYSGGTLLKINLEIDKL